MDFPVWLPGEYQATECKCCGGVSLMVCVVDFNKHCNESTMERTPLRGVPVYYHLCKSCGFIFTRFFDNWTDSDFVKYVYNSQYDLVDPSLNEIRPVNNAKRIAGSFGSFAERISILDWGGGSGKFAEELKRHKFSRVDSCDPFHDCDSQQAADRYDIITSFEVAEHLIDPTQLPRASDLLLKESGAVIYSTLLIPDDIRGKEGSWWYLSPRNGHVSLHSKESLSILWKRFGYSTIHFDDGYTHMAFKELPAFARHLIKP